MYAPQSEHLAGLFCSTFVLEDVEVIYFDIAVTLLLKFHFTFALFRTLEQEAKLLL